MSESVTFTAIYEPVEDGWVQARLAEIPGVITAAPTRQEAEALLLDALRDFVLSFTEPDSADQLSDSRASSGSVKVSFTAPAA
ncbi:MAG: type II toxin-antitoxin system HicB family antitoxin [Pseudonocardiaceae bacterium]